MVTSARELAKSITGKWYEHLHAVGQDETRIDELHKIYWDQLESAIVSVLDKSDPKLESWQLRVDAIERTVAVAEIVIDYKGQVLS